MLFVHSVLVWKANTVFGDSVGGWDGVNITSWQLLTHNGPSQLQHVRVAENTARQTIQLINTMQGSASFDLTSLILNFSY